MARTVRLKEKRGRLESVTDKSRREVDKLVHLYLHHHLLAHPRMPAAYVRETFTLAAFRSRKKVTLSPTNSRKTMLQAC